MRSRTARAAGALNLAYDGLLYRLFRGVVSPEKARAAAAAGPRPDSY